MLKIFADNKKIDTIFESCRYVEESESTARLVASRSAGVAPEVNLREPSLNKTAHSGFETKRGRYQKSKTGQGPRKQD